MQIYGREVGFRFTVGASAKISDLCPDGDITRLGGGAGGPVWAGHPRHSSHYGGLE